MTDSIWFDTSLRLNDIEQSIKDDLLHTDAHDLSVKAIFVLNELYQRDGQRLSELAIAVGNMTTTFSWVVDRLEKRGLVERKFNANDRRSPLICVTDKGRKLQNAIEQTIANAETKYGKG